MKSAAELQHFPPFDKLSETGKILLSRGLHYANFSQQVTVLEKGQRVSGAYVVVEGRLRVFTLTPSGNEATLYVIDPGETCVLALNCIFNDLRYPAWVEAQPGSKVAVVTGALYRALFDAEPAIRNMTVQAFSTIVFRLMAELEDIHSRKLEQRLANFLLTQASSDGAVRMTQQGIARHLGTTREVVARALRQFVLHGWVVTKRNLIQIAHAEALTAMLRPGGPR
jgi:CRP/FNR family transcriptional regulator